MIQMKQGLRDRNATVRVLNHLAPNALGGRYRQWAQDRLDSEAWEVEDVLWAALVWRVDYPNEDESYAMGILKNRDLTVS